MTKASFNWFVMVADYIDEDDYDADLAFELASDNDFGGDAAMKSFKESLTDVGYANIEVLECSFDEFDAANPYHAGAHFTITVELPEGVSAEEVNEALEIG